MAPISTNQVIINGFAFRDVTNETTGATRVMTYEEAYRWTLQQTQYRTYSSDYPKSKEEK